MPERASFFSKRESLEKQDLGFDLVIFDWDGVMLDSMGHVGKAAVKVCEAFGIPIDLKKFKEEYEQPYWKFYEKMGLFKHEGTEEEIANLPENTEEERRGKRARRAAWEIKRQRIAELYATFYKDVIAEDGEPSIFAEVGETIKKLKENGVKVVIISSSTEESIREVLKTNNLDGLIDEVVGSTAEKAEAMQQVVKNFETDPERVLALGDLPADIEDAQKAGIKAAGVARGTEEKSRLEETEPDYLLSSIDEILTLNQARP